MSVVVWDGKTLAADRQASNGNLIRTQRKIWKHGNLLMAGVGTSIHIEAMRNWIMGGMVAEKFPEMCAPECRASVWVINPDGGFAKFENSPYPLTYEDEVFADGSGRDFALGALAMGADAAKAVEVAIRYDTECGMGVDVLTFD